MGQLFCVLFVLFKLLKGATGEGVLKALLEENWLKS